MYMYMFIYMYMYIVYEHLHTLYAIHVHVGSYHILRDAHHLQKTTHKTNLQYNEFIS